MSAADCQPQPWNRRRFLGQGLLGVLGARMASVGGGFSSTAAAIPGPPPGSDRRVALVSCRDYSGELKKALADGLERLGGLAPLVRGETVTVKVNLTGTNFSPLFDRPVGESYMTHPATAQALGTALFAAGARRVRFVESTNSTDPLEKSARQAGWDVPAILALGEVEFENTRNRGRFKDYGQVKTPSGGHMFDGFNLNRAYVDSDVMVSLCKLKNHYVCGVTLSLKNLFGITPNTLYGDGAFNEEATGGRGRLHDPTWFDKIALPGLRAGDFGSDPGFRVPRIVTDLAAARPIHLAVIDGITSMSGGEGPWLPNVRFQRPGVLILGLNPVSADAVGTAVMGYAHPRGGRGTGPFVHGDNHLLLAEQTGLGTADLSRIEVAGLPIQKARCPYTGWGQISG